MSRYFMHAIFAAIVLIAGFGWIGRTLEWGAGVIVTVSLVSVAVLAIVAVALVARVEKRDHER